MTEPNDHTAAEFQTRILEDLLGHYIPLMDATVLGEVYTTEHGRFVRARSGKSIHGLLDPFAADFLIFEDGRVLSLVPAPRAALATLPDQLAVDVDAFAYDCTGTPAALAPTRPLVEITSASKAHWRGFVGFFGPRFQFAMHSVRPRPLPCPGGGD